MRPFIVWICMLVVGLWAPPTWADIYIWVDEEGVQHISNVSPPPHADLLVKSDAPARREVAMSDPQAAQQERELAQLRVEVREREERLARREAQLEQRVEEAEKRVEDALAEARNRVEAAEARYKNDTIKQPIAFSYITRPYAYRHYRYKHFRHRPVQRHGLYLKARPFHPGSSAISRHIDRKAFRHNSRHGYRIGRSRHPGGTHAPLHSRPQRGWKHR